ncbi:MAG: hypothetical protein DSY59_05570 [Persephonella sp.]|nr:MAG: hypothetical protein DSY59_05570 [Persephonella sp.]
MKKFILIIPAITFILTYYSYAEDYPKNLKNNTPVINVLNSIGGQYTAPNSKCNNIMVNCGNKCAKIKEKRKSIQCYSSCNQKYKDCLKKKR